MNLALLLASLASAIIQDLPGISSTIKQIIADIAGSLRAVVGSGIVHQVTPLNVYMALDGVLSQLIQDPNLPQAKLEVVASLLDAVQAAIAADKQAQEGMDPDKIKPIEPLP